MIPLSGRGGRGFDSLMSPIYFLVFCRVWRLARGGRGRAFINSRARVLPLLRAHHDRDGAETRTRASSINSFRLPINLNQKIIVFLVISPTDGLSLSLFLRLSLSLSIHIVLRVLVRRPSFPRRASPGRQLRPEAHATPRSSPVSADAR